MSGNKESYIRQIDNLLENLSLNLSAAEISENYYHVVALAKRIFGDSTYIDMLSEMQIFRPNALGDSLSFWFGSDNIIKLRGILSAMRSAIEHNDYPFIRTTKNSFFGEPLIEPQFQIDVFMVMPFKPELRLIYDHHVRPLVERLGYKIKRGDEVFGGHFILREIFSLSYNCKLVIADCTGQNANVYYELGIAHMLEKPAIIIAQDAKDIRFDIEQMRYIIYEADKMTEFETALQDSIQRLLGDKP